MKSAKMIILPSVFTAILIGGQLALSFISGVEIVTVLMLTFCYKYGVKQGVFVANAFSVLRCIIFGFVPNVLVLYLVYYNLFAVVFGLLGKFFNREYSIKKHAVVICVAVLMTAIFTLIDDAITPLMYGFSIEAARAYFVASLYTAVPQIICTFVTSLVLFPVILKILK